MKSRLVKIFLVVAVAVTGVGALVIGSSNATTPTALPHTIDFFDSTSSGFLGAPNSTTLYDKQPVPSDLVGQVCTLALDVDNNDSPEPNDIPRVSDVSIIDANFAQVTAHDVEAIQNHTTSVVVANVKLGTDLRIYVGFGVAVEPADEPSVGAVSIFPHVTISNCGPPVTTTVPVTTVPAPTTTSQPVAPPGILPRVTG